MVLSIHNSMPMKLMQCQTQFFPIHWWWSNFFLSAHHSLQVHTLQSYPLYCSSCTTPGFLHGAVFTMTEWNSIHWPSWRGKESELFITNNKPLFLLKTNTYNFSLNHFIYWRPHKTTELVRNVTSGQAYNYCNTTSAILPSSLLFSNSSSNIYSSHSAKGLSKETCWEAVLQGDWGWHELCWSGAGPEAQVQTHTPHLLHQDEVWRGSSGTYTFTFQPMIDIPLPIF